MTRPHFYLPGNYFMQKMIMILLAFGLCTGTAEAAPAVPDADARAQSADKADVRTSVTAQARYKRLRAKAHRNAARAKAHARSLRENQGT